MHRRNFLGSATLVPVAALMGAQQTGAEKTPQQTKGVRITVLKKVAQPEFNKYRDGETKVCDAVKDGQQFTIEYPWPNAPKGMCGWAWDGVSRPQMPPGNLGSRPASHVAMASDN